MPWKSDEIINCISHWIISLPDCFSISEYESYYRNCGSGNYLRITSGSYTCIDGYSVSVTSRMNSNCNYNSACTIYCTNSWLGGDPCIGTNKSLSWSDGCYSKLLLIQLEHPCQTQNRKHIKNNILHILLYLDTNEWGLIWFKNPRYTRF